MKHGRYEVVERLGEGESAVVYLTRDLARSGREVAVKVLKKSGGREAAGFRHEFAALASLRHPNLISVIDFGVSEDGALYYSADYQPGQRPLSEAAPGPLAVEEAIALALPILRGLEYVHTRGLLHRDLKPANVLVGDDGDVRLADFGLSGAVEGEAAGTPHYMAPEVLRRVRLDRRCDLYSFGVLLFELLTGALPFDGAPTEVARAHLETDPRSPAELRPELPAALCEVVLRLLAKEPSARYPSANAVIAALAEATGQTLDFETADTKEAYVLSGRFVARDRELDWLTEAFQRATGPLEWERDPREFDRRERFATHRAKEADGERRRGGNRRATRGGTLNPPALMVFVRGESGLGKSRLLDELRRRTQLEGAVFLGGACSKHQARGYEPFVSVMQEAAQLSGTEGDLERHGWAVQRLLAQNGEVKGVERLRLVDALAEFLIAQASRRPLVIALDDLQWARGETVELLLHLYRSLVTIIAGAKDDEDRPQLFIVGTYRPDEMHGPDLGRALRQLKRDRFFEELSLRPFRADDVAELIRSMLGVPNAPRAFVERVMEESAGNPLFVELLMEELVARGVVDRARGLWRLDPERLRELEVPGRVHDLVFSWLERLPHRELLDWLAVIDRAVPAGAVADLIQAGPLDAQVGLDDLVGRRVVRRVATGYELAHAKVRDVVYEGIADKLDRHAAVARALEASLGTSAEGETGSLGEVAHHQLEAGLGLEAIRWARRAGDAAAALGARERACELYARALSVADEQLALHRDDAEKVAELSEAKLGLLRARVHELTARELVLEARSQTLEGLELARQLGDVQAEVSALAHLGHLNAKLKEVDDAKRYFFEALKTAERIEYGKGIGASLLGLGDLTLEEGRLDEALDYLERSLQFEQDLGDGREVSSYLRALANAQRQKGNLERALQAANRAHEQDQTSGDGASELATLELLADLHFLREDYAASVAAGEQGLALAERLDDKAALTRCALALGSAHERAGRRPSARRRLREAAALARRLGLGSELAQALNGLGWLHHVEASYEEALCAFNEATTIWNTQGDREGYALGLANLGLCYRRQGLLERAGSCYDAAVRVGWETSNRRAELEGTLGRARVHALAGEALRAREQLDKTVLRARELKLPGLEARALAELGPLLARAGEGGRALRACQRARTLADEDGDPTVRAEVRLRSARGDQARGALAPTLEALRERASWLRPAADRALEIEAELAYGVALTEVGDFAGAESALDEAVREAERKGLGPLLAGAQLAQGQLLLARGLADAGYRPGRVVLGSAELGEARARFQASRARAQETGANAIATAAALGLAHVALAEGELERAREQVGEVLASLPDDEIAHRREARLLRAAATACDGDPDDALAELDELELSSPQQRLRGATFRALACQRAERKIEARASLEEAVSALEELEAGLEPTDRRALEALPQLVELRAQLEAARADTPTAAPDATPARPRSKRLLAFLRAARDVQQSDQDTQQRLLVDRALALFGAQRGYLARVDAEGEVHVLQARLALGEDAPADERQLSSSVVTHVAQAGEVLVMPDAQQDLRLGERPSVLDLQLRSVLAAPLRIAGRVRFVLVLEDRDSSGRFGDADRELAESLAELLAFGLEHSQLQQRGQRQAAELESRAGEIQRLNAALEAKVAEQTEELDSVKAALKGREYELGLQSQFHNLIGRSEPMLRVFRLLERVADSDVPVLIQGESGTGKELVARAIHFTSARQDKPCLSINCGAMPESLLESELFGHVKGAFTGADRKKQGLFEAADGGTLFLDEVGDMPASMQTKLLRVLQEGEVRAVGSQTARSVNVRIVSASNKDLRQLVDEGIYRADLFYRLNVVSLGLPPLRERKDDIPLLVDHLLDKIAERSGKKRKSVERKVVDHLLHHDWPGNVRELENELRRLVALSGQKITERDLSPHIRQAAPSSRLEIAVPDEETPLKSRLETIERQILVESLRRNENNKTRTAKLLGLSRYGFLKKLDKYGLRDTD